MSDTIRANKAIVGRWFTEFWGNPWNPKVIDDLAAPDMLLGVLAACAAPGARGRATFITGFRGRFRSGLRRRRGSDRRGRLCRRPLDRRRHAHRAGVQRFPGRVAAGRLGRTMRFTGTTVIKVVNGRIAEEVGLDDGVTALTQLGLLRRS